MYQIQTLLKIFVKFHILLIYPVSGLCLSLWLLLSSAGEVGCSPFNKPVQQLRFTTVLSTQEECFHQYAIVGSTLKCKFMSTDWVKIKAVHTGPVEYEVSRTSSSGLFVTNVTEEGPYSYCFTRLSGWSNKVEVFFTFIKSEAQLRILDEVYSVPEDLRNLWETTIRIARMMRKVGNYVFERNMQVSHDRALLDSNASYVHYWSMAQCVVIMLAGITQVWLLRYILTPATVTRSNKPRA